MLSILSKLHCSWTSPEKKVTKKKECNFDETGIQWHEESHIIRRRQGSGEKMCLRRWLVALTRHGCSLCDV